MSNIERKIFLTGMGASAALVACGGKSVVTPPVTPTATPSGSASPSHSPSPTPSASPTASPTPAATATPTAPPGTVAVTIVNDNPTITSSNINIYIFGQSSSQLPTVAWQTVGPTGAMTPCPSVGDLVPAIPWSGTGNSNTLYLPQLTSARIYLVDGTLPSPIFKVTTAGQSPTAPAPWTSDASASIYFDYVEYTYNSSGFNTDTTQVDGIGLSLQLTLVGSQNGTQNAGFLGGAVTALSGAMTTLGGEWATLNKQMPYRVTNPSHGDQGFFTSTSFLDTDIMAAWNAYQSSVFMTITAATLDATDYSGNVYGTVDASSNFNFYTTAAVVPANLLGTIPSPQTYASTNSTTVTMQMFAANGAFVAGLTNEDASYPNLMPAIGDRVTGALNRGVMSTATQPACTGVYPGATYQNQYANYIHQIASNPTYGGWGLAYGYPYDDLCGASTDISDTGPTSITITIHPS